MGRVLLFLVILGAVGSAINWIGISFDPRGVGTHVDGRRVVRESGEVEARFQMVGAVDDAYMLFGGAKTRQRNSLSHVVMAGLPMDTARAIARDHPDFHMCKSPGAKQAQRFTEEMTIVAGSRAARDTLEQALGLFEERLYGSGERTCIALRGALLTLESVQHAESGTDLLTGDLRAAFARNHFVLANHVELADCPALLR